MSDDRVPLKPSSEEIAALQKIKSEPGSGKSHWLVSAAAVLSSVAVGQVDEFIRVRATRLLRDLGI